MEKHSEHIMERKACAPNECRHAAALREIKNAVRKFSHELSQPIMLLEGHLELLVLEKCILDENGIDQFVDIIKKQMDVLHNIHRELRESVAPVQ